MNVRQNRFVTLLVAVTNVVGKADQYRAIRSELRVLFRLRFGVLSERGRRSAFHALSGLFVARGGDGRGLCRHAPRRRNVGS